ncbi:DUF3999 family protein [Flavobacteriaceae bacterium 3-367]|uniref:DUF3999 family protein n=1 Tax=Eudoraea algarum TaxID=3417568 RepID=UPI00328901B8
MSRKASLVFVLFLGHSFGVIGQTDGYRYERELSGVTSNWHQVVLPNAIFNKVSKDLSDIRILGITKDNDTIEAPYILRESREKNSYNWVNIERINAVSTAEKHYVTYQIPKGETINEIRLDFNTPNFDWLLSLEGSQDNQNWFTLLEDYRILAIKNELTDYKFTTLRFTNAKYRYFRIGVKSRTDPKLLGAQIGKITTVPATKIKYPVKKLDIAQEPKTQRTAVNLSLEQKVPVSHIEIRCKDQLDYYRPITIKYVLDSIQTEKGWRYNYATLFAGTLSSLEKNGFEFPSTAASKIQIQIENEDNEPLEIESVVVEGHKYWLDVRFAKEARYSLIYGNPYAVKPKYDLSRFLESIPKNAAPLTLGVESLLSKTPVETSSALFENKFWLWAVMGIIILVLGWFSLNMIRKK